MLKITPKTTDTAPEKPDPIRHRGKRMKRRKATAPRQPRRTSNTTTTPKPQSKPQAPNSTSKGKGGGYRGDMEINSVENNNTRYEYNISPIRDSNNAISTISTVGKHNTTPIPVDDKVNRVLECLKDGYTIADTAEKCGITERSIYRWIADDTHNASQVYASARATRAARQAAELDKIAKTCDDSNNAAVNKARLRCDVIKWQLERHYPDLYGDTARVELTANGTLAPTIGAAAIADVERLRNKIFGIGNTSAPGEVIEGEIIGE